MSNALYYFWVCLLLLFPTIIHQQYKASLNNIDIHFFLLIPCLNEGKVIAATVNNLLSLKMPNLRIVVINDGSTDNTEEILSRIKSNQLIVLNRVYPNARQGKGEALNYAYNFIKVAVNCPIGNKLNDGQCSLSADNSEGNSQYIEKSKVVVGIIDADTIVKRSLLELTAISFYEDPNIGMVQARIRIGESTRHYFLPFLQDLEFFTYINQMQNLREYTGTVAAAGNGQFNRLSAMEQLGEQPWSSCLLEDFDFSLRLLLKGWKTMLVQEESIHQQGVINYKRFVKQRSRWAQGCIQCLPYLNKVIKSPHLTTSGKIEILSFMMLPWITVISTLTLLFSWFLIFYSYWFKSTSLTILLSSYSLNDILTLLIIIIVVIYLPGVVFSILYHRSTQERIFHCLLASLLIPVYNMLQTPAVLIAIYRQIIGINGWIKTDRV